MIKDHEGLYAGRNTKYLVYVCELKDGKYIRGSDFGTREIHDGFDRTVEWIGYNRFKSRNFANKLNWRLRFRLFLKRIDTIASGDDIEEEDSEDESSEEEVVVRRSKSIELPLYINDVYKQIHNINSRPYICYCRFDSSVKHHNNPK